MLVKVAALKGNRGSADYNMKSLFVSDLLRTALTHSWFLRFVIKNRNRIVIHTRYFDIHQSINMSLLTFHFSIYCDGKSDQKKQFFCKQ